MFSLRWSIATDGLTAPGFSRMRCEPLGVWVRVGLAAFPPPLIALAITLGITGVVAIAALTASDAWRRLEMVLRASSASSRRRRERWRERSHSWCEARSRVADGNSDLLSFAPTR